MTQGYLDTLDLTLAAGCCLLSEEFKHRRVKYVVSRQAPDGGFSGRAGGSDIYYTDFALRTLALLGPPHDILAAAADYIDRLPRRAPNVAAYFNRLNCARTLTRFGLKARRGSRPRRPTESAYNAFLGSLCCEMLGVRFPHLDRAVAAVAEMRAGDGGYSDTPGAQTGQTNATAAALAFLRMHDALADADGAVAFIASMQAPAGGFFAHPAAPGPDLLSTFTALVTLSDLASLGRINLADAGRFVRSLAAPDGGFRGAPSDPETDVEYTYYGVGVVALLRGHASGEAGQN